MKSKQTQLLSPGRNHARNFSTHLTVFITLMLFSVVSISSTTGISDVTKQVVLSNGMKLLMVQRDGQPNIAAGWVAHVGSANEYPGITGISHLFEHMMFKGSNRIGTRDADQDQSLRDQLDQVRQRIFEQERFHRQQVRLGYADSIDASIRHNKAMQTLQDSFKQLLDAQKSVLVKDEFDVIYTTAGANRMNAFTNQDMTVYFIQVPKNKLE